MTTLIKLGGSLITDKRKAKSFRRATVADIARQLSELRQAQPDCRVVLGHGSGSYGHYEAQKYKTIRGIDTSADRLGFARVGAVAGELSQLILKELLAAGLPALRFPPSAMQLARNQALTHLALHPLRLSLEQQFLPLVHGDVTLDESLGGTIISTEALFTSLVEPLRANRIILLGTVDGVLDQNSKVIPYITPMNVKEFDHVLGAADGYDVTGGMRQKVTAMIELVRRRPNLRVTIANGNQANILHSLLVQGDHIGTRICAE